MENVKIVINGKELEASEGMTVLEAAKANGIYIPTLCAMEGMKPKAACKLCMVKIEGEEMERLSCATRVQDGMVITTDSPELFCKRKELVQEMLRQHTVSCHHCLRIGSTKAPDFDPDFCKDCYFCDCERDGFCELQAKALEFGVDELPFEIHEHDFGSDCSTGSVIRNMDKCIKCRRCTDVCKAQGVGILGLVKTENGQTVKSKNDLMTDGCVRCGRCVDVCPTGALFMKEHKDEVLYYAHQYGTETAAMLCSCIIDELSALFGEEMDFEQIVSALKKLGIDHVYSPGYAKAASRAQAVKLLDENLGKKPLILTENYAAQTYLRANFPELEESFAFFDSMQKCFGDYMHENRPGVKLINISCKNSNGAEAYEAKTVDYFINPRELYRIFLRTGAAPHRRRPEKAEDIAEYTKVTEYDELLSAGGWSLYGEPEELVFENKGKEYKALICHNLSQFKKAAKLMDKYDVIKVMA